MTKKVPTLFSKVKERAGNVSAEYADNFIDEILANIHFGDNATDNINLRPEFEARLFVGTPKRGNKSRWKSAISQDEDNLEYNLPNSLNYDEYNWSEAAGPMRKNEGLHISDDEILRMIEEDPELIRHNFNWYNNQMDYWDDDDIRLWNKNKDKVFVPTEQIQLDPMMYTGQEYPPWVRGKANKLISGED